jgi:hypothetical protein
MSAGTHVWIVTQQNEAGTEKTVIRHCEKQIGAARVAALTDLGGYEGPVPLAMYPIGHVIKEDPQEPTT